MAWDYRSEQQIEMEARGNRLIDLREVETVNEKGQTLKKEIFMYDDKGYLEKKETIFYVIRRRDIMKIIKDFLFMKVKLKFTESHPNKLLIEDAGGGVINEEAL